MEQAGCRLPAKFRLDRVAHAVEVARHMRVVMTRRVGERVPAVIARVERDHLEIAEKQAPERDVPVDREAVAVTDDEPRAGGIAVPARADDRAVARDDIDDGKRRRRFRYWRPPGRVPRLAAVIRGRLAMAAA
jgi:hypothetical protein